MKQESSKKVIYQDPQNNGGDDTVTDADLEEVK